MSYEPKKIAWFINEALEAEQQGDDYRKEEVSCKDINEKTELLMKRRYSYTRAAKAREQLSLFSVGNDNKAAHYLCALGLHYRAENFQALSELLPHRDTFASCRRTWFLSRLLSLACAVISDLLIPLSGSDYPLVSAQWVARGDGDGWDLQQAEW